MTLQRLSIVLIRLVAVGALASGVAHASPQNPCSGKAANPCEAKHAQNPCNPCGGKAASMAGAPAVNPCFAKMGTVFRIDDPMQRNTVTFRSEAPLEDIVGTTNQIHGYLVFDPNHPKKGGRGEIVVPVAGLRTGIPLRDEHLRGGEWLDAENHAAITFRIDEVEDVREVKRGEGFVTYEATVKGPFTLRGVTKNLETEATLTYLERSERTLAKMEGNLLATRTSFEVSLEKFGIRGFDGVVGSKVGKTIAVDVSLMATDVAAAEAGNPCGGKAMNPCGAKAGNPCEGKHSPKG